jgi:cytochrome c-type biogenesis protein CcmH
MKRPLIQVCAAALAGVMLMAQAASDPAETLKDPAREAKARALFKEVRCLVCQNESIDDSEAGLAADLRRIVRQQVEAGASDVQVRDFLVMRYGKFVLLKPPFDATTAVLWLTPFAVVLGGGAFIFLNRRRQFVEEAPLSAEEKDRLRSLDN